VSLRRSDSSSADELSAAGNFQRPRASSQQASKAISGRCRHWPVDWDHVSPPYSYTGYGHSQEAARRQTHTAHSTQQAQGPHTVLPTRSHTAPDSYTLYTHAPRLTWSRSPSCPRTMCLRGGRCRCRCRCRCLGGRRLRRSAASAAAPGGTGAAGLPPCTARRTHSALCSAVTWRSAALSTRAGSAAGVGCRRMAFYPTGRCRIAWYRRKALQKFTQAHVFGR
jgi:hypothetical protein